MAGARFIVAAADTGRIYADDVRAEQALRWLKGYEAECPGRDFAGELAGLGVRESLRTHPADTRGLKVTRTIDDERG